MRRWRFLLAAAGALLLIGWGLHKAGWFASERADWIPGRPGPTDPKDPMDTSSGWRYRQNTPHHWRYIMLQK